MECKIQILLKFNRMILLSMATDEHYYTRIFSKNLQKRQKALSTLCLENYNWTNLLLSC